MLFKTYRLKWIVLTVYFSLFFNLNNSKAESVEKNNIITASETFVTQLPESIINATYFKNHNKINWENIKEELLFKKNFFTGRRPEKQYIRCHKFQRRISRAIDRSIADKELDIKEVDNEFLFSENSSIQKIMTQTKRPSNNCYFHSIGDPTNGCVLYCDYHGIDFESDFFKQHKKEIESSQPLLTSEDIAEIIIFSPSLLMLLIIWFMWPKKKKTKIFRN